MRSKLLWIAWLLLMLVFLLSTRNPIYILIVMIGVMIIGSHLSKIKEYPGWGKQNIRFILTMIIISTLVNLLFTHLGSTELFSLPESWLLIGGIITLESLLYGAINGLVIGTLYLLFNSINLAFSIKQLTQLIPRGLYPIAMIVTISLTFFPSIQQRSREIKEAQIIRGNPMKKMRDWLPILIPLLVTSLEKAYLLSESMTSRGFHQPKNELDTRFVLTGLITGTFLFFSGWILNLYYYPVWITAILYLIGGLTFIISVFLAGKTNKITRYHQEKLDHIEVLFLCLIAICFAGLLILLLSNNLTSLPYTPYPELGFPEIEFVGLLIALLSLFPILWMSYD